MVIFVGYIRLHNMTYCVLAHEWVEAVSDFLPIPLDDADPFTIKLAQLVNGMDLTPYQLERAIRKAERYAQVQRASAGE